MKKIVIIFIIYFSFIFIVNATVSICDNANIDWTKDTFDEICNDWNKVDNLSDINSFTWNYIDIETGYFWNKNSDIEFINDTKLMQLWYFWNQNTNIQFVEDKKLVNIGYFWNKFEYIKNNNEFIFPIWFLKDFKVENIIKKNIKNDEIIIIPEDIYYYVFLKEYIKEKTYFYSLWKWISKYTYNVFIDNLLEIILRGSNEIIKWEDIELLKCSLDKTNFIDNLKILINNVWDLNYYLHKTNNYNEKLYILRYYLE